LFFLKEEEGEDIQDKGGGRGRRKELHTRKAEKKKEK